MIRQFALLLCKVHLICQQLQDHTIFEIMCINICKQCLKAADVMFVKTNGHFFLTFDNFCTFYLVICK